MSPTVFQHFTHKPIMYRAWVFLLFGLAASYSFRSTDEEWERFKRDFGKAYKDHNEEEMRRNIFKNNLKIIILHNEKYEQKLVNYSMRVGPFADITVEEFTQTYSYTLLPLPNFFDDNTYHLAPTVEFHRDDYPAEVDWRERGAVTEVKDQGECGSCYAFTSAAVIESQWFLKTGELTSLSAQNIIDCSGNLGCDGGLIYTSLLYVKNNGGIDTDKSYPYENLRDRHNFQCRYKPEDRARATVSRVVKVADGEDQLLAAVATRGPIAVAIGSPPADSIAHAGWEGVLHAEGPCNYTHGHAMLVVGYGTDNGNDYWLVKNSYGKDWGMNGYFKYPRNANNYCGISNRAFYPIV